MAIIPWRNKGNTAEPGSTVDSTLTRFRQEFDDLFNRCLVNPFNLGSLAQFGAWGPSLDLVESDNELTVTAELPGVNPKEIEVNVTGNTLTIRGEKKQEREEKGKDFHRVERHYGSFHRSVELPVAVDADQVKAEYKDGVLTLRLPKHPEAKPKKIPVRAE